jgi:hypothetical protein
MGGPVGSPAPGTPAMLIFAGLSAAILGKSVLTAYRRKHDVTGREGWQAPVLVAFMAAFLLAIALWAIWTHANQ